MVADIDLKAVESEYVRADAQTLADFSTGSL